MLHREIIAVCSQIHTKRINTLCGQNAEFLNVKPCGTYTNDRAIKGYISVIKTCQLMLYRDIIAVCSQIHKKHINTLCGKNADFLNVKPCGIHNNHRAVKGQISVTKTSQLMLYREIIAVSSQIHKKHINTLCGKNAEFLNVKHCGIHNNHRAVKG